MESGGFFLEAVIYLKELQEGLGTADFALDDLTTVDLTTSYFDRSRFFYEEYFFSTLFIADIPTWTGLR